MRFLSVLAALLFLSTAALAEFEELPIENPGISRVLSGTSDLLKTTKLQAAGLQILDQPSVEVMVELDIKGELTTLVPSDFSIKTIDSTKRNTERHTSIELQSKIPEVPITLYVDYWYDPTYQYQQKSISIVPCNRVPNAVLKRVTVEAMQLPKTMQPLASTSAGIVNETKSSFAAVDAKSGKGVCFSFPAGKVELTRFRALNAYQQMDIPLEKGFETGRFAIGAVSGTPAAAFATYRQMVLSTLYPALAKDAKFIALRKQFAQCFANCQYLPSLADGQVDAECHVAANRGFILLFNSSSEAKTVALPLADPGLGLTGDLNLADWTSVGAPAGIGTKKQGEKVEIEVPAKGYKIVGVNIDG